MRQALRQVLTFLVLFLPILSSQLSAQSIQTESFGGRDVVAGEIIVRFREGSTPPAAAAESVSDIVTAAALTPARATLLRSRTRTVAELLQEYSGRPDVLYAEPNYVWRKNDVPNDPFFSSQWALSNTGQQIAGQTGVSGADIGAIPAWDIAQGSRSIVIGVVDSGIDYNHPDLAANIWSAPTQFTVVVGGQPITCAAGTHGFNAIARTCDPMDDELESHGSHVAGIIGADGDNGIGISGVSRVASMMALKFIGPNGTGSTANAIAAIEFATRVKSALGVAANVRVLNASWGSNTFSQALLDAVNSAAGSDMLFVAAAGNDGANSDLTPHYPSGFNATNIISVASTTNRDALYEFSNFGLSSVDLGAPGNNIGSTRPPMTYVFEGGTSMAAAMVSGAAGLVLSACNLSAAQLRTTLFNSVDVVASLQGRTATGGRLNVYRALVNCTGGSAPVFTLKSQSSFVLPDPAGSATATILMNPLNGFSADVSLAASAPLGFAVTLASPVVNAGSNSTTLNVTADGSVVPGTYVIHVTGTGGGISRTAGLSIIVGVPISLGQGVAGSWLVDTSQPDRFRTGLPLGLADWYRVVVNSSTTLEVSLHHALSSSNVLRLLDSSGAVLVTANTSSNNILQISRTVSPGSYSIVASTGTSFFSSNNYSLAVNAPLLRTLNPNGAQQGSTTQVQLSGSQFQPGLTVDAGSDIAVSNVVFNNAQSATATFAISLSAALGDRPVTVSTPSGISNPVTFTVTRPRPVITSVTPASAVVGTSVDISILGNHFIDAEVDLIAVSLPGLTLDNVIVVNPTLITARITIAANATVQNISIRVTTLGGFTTISFQILPLPPVLTSISPLSGSLGTTVDVTLTGEQFFGPMTINAGSGITFSNLSISLGRTTATARFDISPTTTLGIRNISVTTPGGTSATVLFTVVPGPSPTLTSLSPGSVPQTTTRILDVRGTNFTTGLVLDAGPDIAVTGITIVNGTRANITILIGDTAALGPRNVTVTTPGGTTNPLVLTVLPPPPTLISMSPASAAQESTVNVTLTGTSFVPGMTFQIGSLPATTATITDSTTAVVAVTIPPSTQTGTHNAVVITASGVTAPLTFTVLPGIPGLTEIRPSFGVRGRSNSVTLLGKNFATGSTTISPLPGVTIGIMSVSGGSVTANFVIDATAPLGSHDVTVTTPGGTTSAVAFSIFDPFPDLSVSTGTTTGFFAGLNGSYGIGLSNNGTAAATTPITITDSLPPGLTFVSASGNGFSCSANGQLVTCTYLNVPFTPLSITSALITVAISETASGSLSHTVSVPYPQDLQPSDNSASSFFLIQPTPTPVLTFSPSILIAGQQANVSLALPTALPQAITGTLNLQFSSSALNPADDPAIQFATGGRQVSFVIPANTLQARFGGSIFAGPVGYQTGTIAGSISFSGTAQMGTVTKSFSSTLGGTSLTIAPAPPVLQNIRRESTTGLGILVTSLSTSRSVTELILQFNTTPRVEPSCGSVAGCTASGVTLTLNVKSLFDTWFIGSLQFGSLNTLRIPLSIQGNVHGSVTITYKNALGSSNPLSVGF